MPGMKTLLLTIAAFGLAVSSVQACPYQNSVQSEQVDPTVVASVAEPRSTPVADPQPAEEVTPEVEAE